MNREIKFRGRCDRERSRFFGKWIYGLITKSNSRGKPLLIQEDDGLHTQVNPATIGQFTGLLDKNGTKIYEGDILLVYENDPNLEDVKTPVYFENGCFMVDVYMGRNCLHEFTWGCTSRIKVIGNIHDNPELMPEEDGE